ncbi:hypothetical protein ACFL6C_13570 [Myxococcota bacterium]
MRQLFAFSLALFVACAPAPQQLAEPAPKPPPEEGTSEKLGRCHLSCCTDEVRELQARTAREMGDPSIANECCSCEDEDRTQAKPAGHGVPNDPAQSLHLLQKACRLGSEEACLNRDLVSPDSTPAASDVPAMITFVDVDGGDLLASDNATERPQPSESVSKPALGCTVTPEMEFPLFFQLKRPRQDSLVKLKKHLGKREWLCWKKGGWAYTSISRRDAENLLGKHARFGCSPNAGNRIGANAYFARVEPGRWVPKDLRAFVRRIEFNDDPKFYAVDDPTEIECSNLR